ncbi:MAG: aminodeoxychorismate/anthranilate synthase component II [Cyclobacteriaceae bacterium]|nr:aminodeoxychorismate/anthranilate synthase component II [Cyclobacteriaceae bacterium]
MQVLLIDNNDSFTYNIVGILQKNNEVKFKVIPSDIVELEDIDKFDKIIISPGPGKPSDFPILKRLFDKYKKTKPILGICLGHQAVCEYFGGKLMRLNTVVHGQKHSINIENKNTYLYANLPDAINVGLYHSWVIDIGSKPDCLKTTGVERGDVLMSVSHKEYDIHGVQFHPESFMTEHGNEIINNFLRGKAE